MAADLHDFQLCLAHGWARGESQDFQAPAFYKDPHKTTVPKFIPAKDFSSEPVIPNPALFEPLAKPSPLSSVTELPSVSQCAAHLELLEAIHTLRIQATGPPTKRVWRKEVIRQKYKHVPYDVPDATYPERAEKKLDEFLTLAVLRFEIWAKMIDKLLRESDASEPTLPHLPPLDVLAVWHSFLLNPGDYLGYCKWSELQRLPMVPFPWAKVNDSIRSQAVRVGFELHEADVEWFENRTQQPASLIKAMEGEDGKLSRAVSEALSAYSHESSDGLRGVLSSISKDDQSYALVRLLVDTNRKPDNIRSIMDNVIRQGSFVDKMHLQLWLRSPAIEGTLRRAIDRYDKLTQLFRDFPGQVLVPTLDMDLVWHTHQLSHSRYRAGIKAITGKFIDHDDKIAKGVLSVKEDGTRRLFEDVFDEEYMRCMCWDCEAIFSAAEIDDGRSLDEGDLLETMAAKVRADVQFHRGAEVARGKGGWTMEERKTPLPVRREAAPY